ncbi:MAG: hypothetical protein Fur005_46050 [Roseiflexaceae bacterium]
MTLNGRTLSGVTLLSPTTLQVPIPSDLAPGRYQVRVVNPGGQRALVEDVLLGSEVFLPLVRN